MHNDDDSRNALEEELRQVEADLENAKRSAAELRRQIGERSDAPTDEAERTSQITLAEEQEALAALLEERREELRRRLGLE